ncbi:MAG TPA: patatin-like phospholipase family protein [Noviherbaspirillum sp.]|nr:patatin-like phospholipase family protein [Noviherbaspirillum sp.]
MSKKVVLLLQGGGALGAFQCGAWKALFPFMRENGHELVAVAGTSIGAVNAGLIARHCHAADGGSDMLERFWRTVLATAPIPFLPFPGEYWRAWNGLLTGLLLGNGALFHPLYLHWNQIGDMFRFHMPLYQTENAEQTLAQTFGEYHGRAPLLAVSATDVASGEAVLFNSASQTITPKVLAASMAIPILFPSVELDGRHYWDAEVRSNSLLPDVFALLRQQRQRQRHAKPSEFLVIVVDMFRPDATSTPTTTIQSYYRLLDIVLGNKLKYDQRAFETGNAYLEAMERIHRLASHENRSPLTSAIGDEYKKALAQGLARVEFLHVGRRHFEYEYISRDFDYSPQYIARLIAQGVESASNAIKDYQQRDGTEGESGFEPFHRVPRPSGSTKKHYPRLV